MGIAMNYDHISHASVAVPCPVELLVALALYYLVTPGEAISILRAKAATEVSMVCGGLKALALQPNCLPMPGSWLNTKVERWLDGFIQNSEFDSEVVDDRRDKTGLGEVKVVATLDDAVRQLEKSKKKEKKKQRYRQNRQARKEVQQDASKETLELLNSKNTSNETCEDPAAITPDNFESAHADEDSNVVQEDSDTDPAAGQEGQDAEALNRANDAITTDNEPPYGIQETAVVIPDNAEPPNADEISNDVQEDTVAPSDVYQENEEAKVVNNQDDVLADGTKPLYSVQEVVDVPEIILPADEKIQEEEVNDPDAALPAHLGSDVFEQLQAIATAHKDSCSQHESVPEMFEETAACGMLREIANSRKVEEHAESDHDQNAILLVDGDPSSFVEKGKIDDLVSERPDDDWDSPIASWADYENEEAGRQAAGGLASTPDALSPEEQKLPATSMVEVEETQAAENLRSPPLAWAESVQRLDPIFEVEIEE